MVTIRDAAPADEAAWRKLWAGYLTFYKAEVAPEITSGTWARILNPQSAIFCRVAELAGNVVGFAVCVVHEGTWVTTPILYLEDLFVESSSRGAGVGKALIADLLELCAVRGFARLYWHTDADNAQARRLYDQFIEADAAVRYRLTISPSAQNA